LQEQLSSIQEVLILNSEDKEMLGSIAIFASITVVLSFFIVVTYTPNLSFGELSSLNNYNTKATVDSSNKSSDVTHIPKTTSTATVQQSTTNATTTTVTKISKPAASVDKFGIDKMYPTKKGGREWYINMVNPENDSIFSIGSGQWLVRQSDGSWRNTNPQVRMHVSTPLGLLLWKNVEMTGYVKVESIKRYDKDIPIDIAWLARGDIHNGHIRCSGTALNGGIHNDGTVGWKKELWFPGGYTDERSHEKVTNSIVGRWIGWKVVMYNIANNTAVKMESYLDDNNNNHWTKVTDLVDDGGWYARGSDKKFYSAGCGVPKNQVLTNAGPIAAFRSDNMIIDFANLSIREIEGVH
jgi:hypothetical protein